MPRHRTDERADAAHGLHNAHRHQAAVHVAPAHGHDNRPRQHLEALLAEAQQRARRVRERAVKRQRRGQKARHNNKH